MPDPASVSEPLVPGALVGGCTMCTQRRPRDARPLFLSHVQWKGRQFVAVQGTNIVSGRPNSPATE